MNENNFSATVTPISEKVACERAAQFFLEEAAKAERRRRSMQKNQFYEAPGKGGRQKKFWK